MTKEPSTQQSSQTPSRTLGQSDFTMRPSTETTFAVKEIKLTSERNNRRVIIRAKALIAVVVLSLYLVWHTLATVLPTFLKTGTIDVAVGSLLTFNAGIQLTSSTYFLFSKDPKLTASILKLVMILTGLQLVIGLLAYGSLLLTLCILGVQYFAYTQVSSLKYGGLE